MQCGKRAASSESQLMRSGLIPFIVQRRKQLQLLVACCKEELRIKCIYLCIYVYYAYVNVMRSILRIFFLTMRINSLNIGLLKLVDAKPQN